MSKRIILGVMVTNRVKDIPAVQKVLTEHGCNIKTRLGLHEMSAQYCSPQGLLLLETCGKASEILAMERKLKKIKCLTVKKMVF